MSGSKIDTAKVFGWALGGILILTLAPAAEPVREFAKGLVGSPTASQPDSIGPRDLRAELAQPALLRELETGESEELFQGLTYYLLGRDAEALPILGKLALLGDVRAQGAIGGMYYFGMGLPFDRKEGIRWLRLAARQGGLPERQTLAAALSGTWEWDESVAGAEMAYAAVPPQAAPYAPALPRSLDGLGLEAGTAYGSASVVPGSAPIGTRGRVEGVFGWESASRAWLTDHGQTRSGVETGLPQIGGTSPVTLNPAGPGAYADGHGDIYAQAGPYGVVNTRTGEFSPTN